jgi:glutamyl-tRNA(Gln) amidotransferase subunit D
MAYVGFPKKLLDKAELEPGDIIEIHTPDGITKGILMPRHGFSRDDVLVLKLESGYNVGINIAEGVEVKLVEKGGKQSQHKTELRHSPGKPNVSIVSTGGTIASYVEYRTGAVHPAVDAEGLAASVPELAELCNVRAKVLYSIVSEDMSPEHWQGTAKAVAEELNSGARGVIVPHGTDTMGFTSAALSFMLGKLSGPVILVGAQRSSDRPSSDAYMNLLCAARLAAKSDLGEVVVLMHSGTSDQSCTIHGGTRVRKMHTSRRDAFSSVNHPVLGRMVNGNFFFEQSYRKAVSGEKIEPALNLEKAVSLLYFHPGMNEEILEKAFDVSKGVVLAGTGLGHVSSNLVSVIRDRVKEGKYCVMTSQCLNGRVNMWVYDNGRDLLKAGVLSGEDMLPETAMVKLMWVLGQTDEPEKVKKFMQTNLAGEISARRPLEEKTDEQAGH